MALSRLEITQSPWIVKEELHLKPNLEITPVSPRHLAQFLELDGELFSPQLLDSIYSSDWYSVDNGRIVLEVKNRNFQQLLTGAVHVVDFDDCVASATEWHKREYKAVAESTELHDRGVFISEDDAQKIYQLSKIEVPGKATHEKRYTPRLNIALLSYLTKALEHGVDYQQAWEQMTTARDYWINRIVFEGEQTLDETPFDAAIVKIFQRNSLADFVYRELTDDLFFKRAQHDNDTRIIATRGTIGGFLGQIYKLHSSGVSEEDIDVLIYSNDIKVESLLLLSQIIPSIKDRQVRVFDDNADEIHPYRQLALDRGIPNVEIIRVRHKNAKRKGDEIKVEPDATVELVEDDDVRVGFDHFFPIQNPYSTH